MIRRRRVFALCSLAAPGSWLAAQAQGAVGSGQRGTLRVAAASDVQFALVEIAALFEQEFGIKLLLQFGSSGNLSRQIRQGLAVDVFLSADEAYVFQLVDAQLTRGRGQRYAKGRLVLLAPRASGLVLDEQMEGLRSGIAGVQRFAIANPDHAPYGRAAREALQSLGMWDLLQPRLVLGENVSQAAQFVASGAAQAGITALSLVRTPQVERLTQHRLLPERLHQPLLQRMVVLKSAPSGAEQLVDFMRRPATQALLRRHGFVDPP